MCWLKREVGRGGTGVEIGCKVRAEERGKEMTTKEVLMEGRLSLMEGKDVSLHRGLLAYLSVWPAAVISQASLQAAGEVFLHSKASIAPHVISRDKSWTGLMAFIYMDTETWHTMSEHLSQV